VPVTDKSLVAQSTAVRRAVDTVSAELGDNGRVCLRPSGTEQLVRAMVRAVPAETAQAAADRLAGVVSTASTAGAADPCIRVTSGLVTTASIGALAACQPTVQGSATAVATATPTSTGTQQQTVDPFSLTPRGPTSRHVQPRSQTI